MLQDIFSHNEFKTLSNQQQQVIEAIEVGNNVLVTGGAGTGKSHLLQYLKRHYTKYGLAVTAATGIAAVNISGATIHSWAGIGLANMPLDQIIRNLFSSKFNKVRRKIKLTNILAIDEISMISAELLEILDGVFQAVRENKKPMGGMQILLFGDFLQLPPIAKYDQKTNFCFKSKIWENLNLQSFNLNEIFRQNDEKFIKILNNLRFGILEEDDIEHLKSRINSEDKNKSIRPTILTTHNYKADQINESELKKIPREEKTFQANYFGDDRKIEFLQKNCMALANLKLKVGAQVMMIKNTYQKEGIINGSLGIIKDFSQKKYYPIVEFSNGKILTINPEEWLMERFDEEKKDVIIEAGLTQIPLILSWAITIHKSQGLTLDKISCDLSDVFSEGQAYVALSRARNLEGVFIKSINFNKIIANEDAAEFYRKMQ
ncbi:MAG TPA: PIF1 family ATP-dependent DNA helicase [Rickettsiales bacterium]|nr:PIF1 family ATP-dependent DNA helicase [Rickettsiales bacterium]